MRYIKMLPVLILAISLIGCGKSIIKNETIVENIILNESSYSDVKEIFPNMDFEKVYNETTNIIEYTKEQYVDYTINNVDGEFSLYFDNKTDKLLHVSFYPKDYSIESGEALKTWVFDKYSDYEQITKDTGFVFSNGSENVELYITENPIDDTQYYGLYIEWSIVE